MIIEGLILKMETKSQSRLQQFEVLAYFVAFILAVGLRFFRLGELPLGDLEATNALQAMKIASGSSVSVGGEPGYVILTSILFFVLGHSEFWARFWPAAFGVGLVFTPLLFKRWLGTRPAAILALFFAVEPGFVALSRTATGTMIAVVGLLAATGFLLDHKPVPAGIFAALALLGGTAIWPGLIGLLLGLAVFLAFQKRLAGSGISTSVDNFSLDWKTFLLSTGGTLLILGTLFFIQPKTISGVGSSIVDYFSSWAQTGAGVSIKVMLVALLGEQLLAILLAFWGAVSERENRREMHFILGFWAIFALTITFLNPSRQIVDWVWTLLPLWIFAAFGLDNLLIYFSSEGWVLKTFQTMITFALLIFSALNCLSFVMGTQNVMTVKSNYIISILLPLILLILITILVGWGWSVDAARQGILLGVGLILVGITFGTAVKAMGIGPRPQNELWRSDALPVGSNLLMRTVDNLSLWNTQQINGIDVTLLNQEKPSLQWALRDLSSVKTSDVIGDNELPSLVISLPNYSLTLSQSYRGQSIIWTDTPILESMTASDWVKWFVFRNPPKAETTLLLWARNDLFKN
jgi:hypothetical protein